VTSPQFGNSAVSGDGEQEQYEIEVRGAVLAGATHETRKVLLRENQDVNTIFLFKKSSTG
jgi:hypothetical protein